MEWHAEIIQKGINKKQVRQVTNIIGATGYIKTTITLNAYFLSDQIF